MPIPSSPTHILMFHLHPGISRAVRANVACKQRLYLVDNMYPLSPCRSKISSSLRLDRRPRGWGASGKLSSLLNKVVNRRS